jgi:hypothetical protein
MFKINVGMNVSPVSGVTEKGQQNPFLRVSCVACQGQKYGQLIRFAGIKETSFRYVANG